MNKIFLYSNKVLPISFKWHMNSNTMHLPDFAVIHIFHWRLNTSKNYPVRFDKIFIKYWYRYIMSFIFKIHVPPKISLVLWNTVESLNFMEVSVREWSKLLLVFQDNPSCVARLVHYSWHIHSFLRNTFIGGKRWTINQSIKQSINQPINQSMFWI